MGKKKRKEVPTVDYSSDECTVSFKKKKLAIVSDSESDRENICSHNMKLRTKVEEENTPSKSRKKKILRCADSSDDNEVASTLTPKQERLKKLHEMKKRVTAKKLHLHSSSGSEASSDEALSDENLPMWKHEETLPPEEVEKKSDCDLSDFVVDDSCEGSDDIKENDLSEAEVKLEEMEGKRKKSKKKRTKKTPKKVQSANDEDVTASSEEEPDYGNPYMQRNDLMETANIMDVLSKNTDKDKRNAKKYKREMGKYQYAVHSDKNKAANLSNKARFAKNMECVKSDRGFKVERNLDVKDEDYYEYKETCLYGERIRLYPHTKRFAKYNSKCAFRGCGKIITMGESRIVGITKFCDVNLKFMKKLNNFGNESFYYVCASHLPKSESGSESYSSNTDED